MISYSNQLEALPATVRQKWQALLSILHEMGSVVVAFSGGVDSALLSAAAYQALGERMLAITADSPVNASGELEAARQLAVRAGFPHLVVQHDDLAETSFTDNPPDRCYHCKLARLQRIQQLASSRGYNQVTEGSNADDDQDYRPGSRAVAELGVRSPLAEAGLVKAEVRSLAHALGLPVWDKPSAPCLATRFPYGTVITRPALAQVDQAEAYLHGLGFQPLRVRHLGDTARIEVAPGQLVRLVEHHAEIVAQLKKLGFKYIAADLQGYRQGSMNEVLTT